jgi:hypothetical protein
VGPFGSLGGEIDAVADSSGVLIICCSGSSRMNGHETVVATVGGGLGEKASYFRECRYAALFQPRGRFLDHAEIAMRLHVDIALEEAQFLLQLEIMLHRLELGQTVAVVVPVFLAVGPA